MANIPSGYSWVRDVYPDAQWSGADKTIKLPNGKTLMPGTDYQVIDNKAYFKPVSPGNIWTRDLVPNAQWKGDGTIDLPGLGTLQKNQYDLDVNGRSYVNPSQVGKMYMDKASQPLNPETFKGYTDIAKQVYQPLYDQQADSFGRLIDTLTTKLDARLQNIQANAGRAKMNLETQNTKEAEALRNASIARGTYTSGVADYEQRKLAGEYAPQYGQLESELNAQTAEANAAIGGNLEEIASKSKDLNRDYMSQVAQGAMGMYDSQMTKDQNAYLNFLKLVGVNDERIQAVKDGMMKQAAGESEMFGKVTTQDTANQFNTPVGTQTLQGEKANLEAAMGRAQQFGRVTSQADADLLGVPVGASTFEALDAAAERKKDLEIAYAQIASSERQGSGDTDMRNFTKDLQVWELTGKAPDSAALRSYGIQPGTAWTGTSQDQVAKMKADAALAEQQKVNALNEQSAVIKTQFGLPDDNTAQAAGALFTNLDRASALAKFNQSKDQLKKEGVDINALEKALNVRYPDIVKWTLPSEADYNTASFAKPDLTRDYAKMDQVGQEVRTFLTRLTEGAAKNDPQSIRMLQGFYQAFPAGKGDLYAKAQFARQNMYQTQTSTIGPKQ